MQPNPSDLDGRPGRPGPNLSLTFHVMLVVADIERHRSLRDRVALQLPQGVVDSVDTALEAMLRVARRPPELLVLDLAIGGALAPALMRHLARLSPSSSLLVFDDIERRIAGAAYDVWPWFEADAVFQHWLNTRRPPAVTSN